MPTVDEVLRTPDDRFLGLPGFAYTPRYLSELPGYEGLRMHYVDEGPLKADQPTYLCCHGQPTWSYLFRRMIAHFAKADRRIVVPDLFGFGRSDKPTDERVHTFEFHRCALRSFIQHLGLRQVVLVVHDWGGVIGLTLPMEFPERISGILILNTFLGTGDVPLGQGFLKWQAWCNSQTDMNVQRLMKRACPHLSEEEAAAYEAPFPDSRYKAAIRRIPNIVPSSVNSPGARISRDAREWLGRDWRGQSLMVMGMQDPVVLPANMRLLATWVRGCTNLIEIPEAGHFVPEWGETVADTAIGIPW